MLRNRLIAEEISGGHAFTKHVVQRNEFPGLISDKSQFSQYIERILNNPNNMIRTLQDNRTAYWDKTTGTVVVRTPSAKDGGTAFRPDRGYGYFLNELK